MWWDSSLQNIHQTSLYSKPVEKAAKATLCLLDVANVSWPLSHISSWIGSADLLLIKEFLITPWQLASVYCWVACPLRHMNVSMTDSAVQLNEYIVCSPYSSVWVPTKMQNIVISWQIAWWGSVLHWLRQEHEARARRLEGAYQGWNAPMQRIIYILTYKVVSKLLNLAAKRPYSSIV